MVNFVNEGQSFHPTLLVPREVREGRALRNQSGSPVRAVLIPILARRPLAFFLWYRSLNEQRKVPAGGTFLQAEMRMQFKYNHTTGATG